MNDSLYLIDSLNDELDRFAHKINFINRYKIDSKRSKRSTVKERYVETLVVGKHFEISLFLIVLPNYYLILADKSMKDFYEYTDLENYLLTIMNMVCQIKRTNFEKINIFLINKVNSLFYEPSVGNLINIRVARVIILDENEVIKMIIFISAIGLTIQHIFFKGIGSFGKCNIHIGNVFCVSEFN